MSDTIAAGFLNINKPLGITSHDVVARVRRGLKIKKVGHAGTLDPLATGVLVVCVGYATRLSEYAVDSRKRYRARVHLGVTTESYDAEGDIVARCDASEVGRDDVQRILPAFTGEIEQLPPMYSAVKQGGRKLYELARAGQTVERKSRTVRIYNLELIAWEPPEFTLDVECGAGTYIRSLAYDIGDALGVGAHLSGLTRTGSGSFSVEDAVSLDDLLVGDWRAFLQPPDSVLMDYPALHLDRARADDVRHGRAVANTDGAEAEFARAYAPDGTFIAVLKAADGLWRPHKVFSAI